MKRKRMFTPAVYRAAADRAEKRAGQWLDKMSERRSDTERMQCYRRIEQAMADCWRWRAKADKLEIEDLM